MHDIPLLQDARTLLPTMKAALFALLIFSGFPAFAADPDWTAHFRARFPATPIHHVRETPISGLFEVVMGSNVVYADTSGRYLFFGHLWDAQTQKDLSAETLESLAPPENPAPELPAPKGE